MALLVVKPTFGLTWIWFALCCCSCWFCFCFRFQYSGCSPLYFPSTAMLVGCTTLCEKSPAEVVWLCNIQGHWMCSEELVNASSHFVHTGPSCKSRGYVVSFPRWSKQSWVARYLWGELLLGSCLFDSLAARG